MSGSFPPAWRTERARHGSTRTEPEVPTFAAAPHAGEEAMAELFDNPMVLCGSGFVEFASPLSGVIGP
jgi:hypothetical protein